MQTVMFRISLCLEMTYEKVLGIGDSTVSLEILDTAGNVSMTKPTPRKYAFWACGHLDFEAAVTAKMTN